MKEKQSDTQKRKQLKRHSFTPLGVKYAIDEGNSYITDYQTNKLSRITRFLLTPTV